MRFKSRSSIGQGQPGAGPQGMEKDRHIFQRLPTPFDDGVIHPLALAIRADADLGVPLLKVGLVTVLRVTSASFFKVMLRAQ